MHFANTQEVYGFHDWLEFCIAPSRNMSPTEAQDKAIVYIEMLKSNNPHPDAVKTLDAYRRWAKTNTPITWLNHGSRQ